MKNPFHIIKYKTIKWLEYLGAIFYLLLGPIFLFIIGFPNNLDKVFIFFLIFMIAIIPFLGKKLTRMGVAQWIWGCFLIPFISIILWLFIGYVIVVAAGVFGKGVAVENLIRNINIYKGEQIREAPFLYNEKWKVKPSSKLDYIDVSTDGTIQKGDQLDSGALIIGCLKDKQGLTAKKFYKEAMAVIEEARAPIGKNR